MKLQTLKFCTLLAFLAFWASPALSAPTPGEVDFSCIKERVRGETQLTDRYKEYDIILRNQCPGDAYWAMCIERLDPWTHETIETHNPEGFVEKEKKSRVNLHMKRVPHLSGTRARLQEFYVGFGYAIDSQAKAPCVAAKCEALKKSVRTETNANQEAWFQANEKLDALVEQQCPDSGWDASNREVCEAELRASAQADLDGFEQNDRLLQLQMAEIDPENCQVYAGDVVTTD